MGERIDDGIDYAWSHPPVASILAYGAKWVARYLSQDPTKNLTLGERDRLQDAGLGIVLVYEDEVGGPLKGYAHGQADAARAIAQAEVLGYPHGCAIYYAVDFDATEGQEATIEAYLRGCRDTHSGRYEVGAYGGYYPIMRLFNSGTIRYGWQTYAWSGGQWDSRAQLRQVRNGIAVGGADCDRDERWIADAGIWWVGDGMAGVLDNPTVANNLVQEIDYALLGLEEVPQINSQTGVEEKKTIEPNVKLRKILEGVLALQSSGVPVTISDEQVDRMATKIVTGLSASLGDMVAGIADSVASEMSRRLANDA